VRAVFRLAGCARLAAADNRPVDSKRMELASAYGDRALIALRQVIDRGFSVPSGLLRIIGGG
jgi:hypothetical protein